MDDSIATLNQLSDAVFPYLSDVNYAPKGYLGEAGRLSK